MARKPTHVEVHGDVHVHTEGEPATPEQRTVSNMTTDDDLAVIVSAALDDYSQTHEFAGWDARGVLTQHIIDQWTAFYASKADKAQDHGSSER